VVYTSALTSPPRFQWEKSSSPSQSTNCGPTCVTKIADLYNDAYLGIETTRGLVTDCCHPTTYQQQADMLTKRGVPASLVNISSLSQLTSIVRGGKRPCILAVHMSRVPAAVRGHNFTGWHAIVCLEHGWVNGVEGYWMNDPNFSPPGGPRPDPAKGRRWYPASVVQSAFLNNDQHWAIVPDKAKYIPPPPPPPLKEPTADDLADGDPYPMRVRRITSDNDRFEVLTVRAGKPVRRGRLVTNKVWDVVPRDAVFYAFARIPKADMPSDEQKYGDVLVGLWYHVNGDHLGYVKEVDLK
jgi:hypothetical protein